MRFALVPVVLALALAAGAAEAEPTIDELLEKAAKMAAKPAGGQPAGPVKGLPESAYYKAMRERLSMEMGKRADDCKRRNDCVGYSNVYFETQQFDLALNICTAALPRGNADYQVRTGAVHQAMARIHFMLGQEEAALKDLEEVANRTDNTWTLEHIENLKKWGKAVPGNQEKAGKLKEKLAANPQDADSRWQLMAICRGDVPMMLDEFLGTIQFKESFPDHKAVTDGGCDWRLMELFWHFSIQDEALKLAAAFREKYPKSGITERGDATYRLGEYSEQMKRYPEALACYTELREKYEKHWACQPRPSGPPYILERILAMKRAISGH